jgi:creatinine amidohydrolase
VIHRLEELEPSVLEARLAEKPALVLALGTIEWHSHHLPLGLDLLKAQAIAERTAELTDAVLAPASWWAAGGVPAVHAAALRLRDRTRARRRPDGFAGMAPGDLPAERPLRPGELDRGPPRCSGLRRGDRNSTRRLRAAHRPRRHGDHAGVFETALLLPDRPDLVHLEIEGDLPGVIGDDPRGRATPELGEQALELASSRAAALLERALVEPREPIAEALATAVEALEVLSCLRMDLPREHVPPVTTPA